MLTSYMVNCPHRGCNWFGSLMPKGDTNSWLGSVPRVSVVDFQCPKCRRTWQGRVIGDDVEMLPLEEAALSVG
jgi:hypothetical protein